VTTFLFHGTIRSQPGSLVGIILDGVVYREPWSKAAKLAPHVEWQTVNMIRPERGDHRGVLLTEHQMQQRARKAAEDKRQHRLRRQYLETRRPPGYVNSRRALEDHR
jgi:hypothetical protein